MKFQVSRLAVSTALWFALSANAQVQSQEGTAAAPPRTVAEVAVVDIGEIFQNHPNFTARMEALKKEVQQYEQQLEAKGKDLVARKQELDAQATLRGTPEYKTKEEQLARMQADLAVEAQGKRKEFIEQEAQLYYDTYNHVQQLVQQYATAWKIKLVLRFNRIEMKAEDRATILQGVNRPVVYYSPSLDITNAIVTYLKSTEGQAAAAQASRQRPGAAAATAPPRQR